MIPFKKYVGTGETPDWFDADATVISRTSLEKLMFERPDYEYCIIVPHNLQMRAVHENVRVYFQNHRYSLYPIAARNRKQYGRIYMTGIKPHVASKDFRDTISDAYDNLKNFTAIYTNGKIVKVLGENGVKTYEEPPSISKFQEIVTEILGKKTEILGVEVPLNEDTQYHFNKNNLVAYPLTNYDRQHAKNWNNYLND